MSAKAGAIGEPYAGTIEVEYGLIKWLKVRGLYLFVFIALLLCQAVYIEWDNDFKRFDRAEPDNEVTVTATPGYISISTDTIDNINEHLVASNSSVPVNLTFQAEDGRILSTILNVLPSSSLCFESEEPLTITASAS